jgi:hypothetical protein
VTAFSSIKSQLPWPICNAAPTEAATVIRVKEGANALKETIITPSNLRGLWNTKDFSICSQKAGVPAVYL